MASPTPDTSALDLLRRRVKVLFGELPSAVAGDEEAIHELRIASRRLRTALPVLALRPGGKRPARCCEALRRLTRASGTARDVDVAGRLLNAHLALRTLRTPVSSVLRRHMREARRRSHARLAQTLLDANIGRLRADLGLVLARGAADSATALVRCASQARARRALVATRLAALGARLDAVALHAVRRGVRRLRYLLELRDELTGQATEAPRLLNGVQDALGRIHDQHLLASWLGGQRRRAAGRGEREQAQAAAHLRAGVERAIGHLHRSYLDCRPRGIVLRAMEPSGRAAAGLPRVTRRRSA